MIPIVTYGDFADETYYDPNTVPLALRRGMSRLIVRDSNTAFQDFLLVALDVRMIEGEPIASIRMHRDQVRALIKSLQAFLKRTK